uniref:Uncharacterized protein n=2 Tax=Anser TaxID=8842 RepID=A0A8B9CE03_9AVES
MFHIKGLGLKMDPEELRCMICRDVFTSIPPFILKKLDSV